LDATPNGIDVAIDDASHVADHQQFTIGFLINHMNKESLYVIEDLHTERPTKIDKTLNVLQNYRKTGNMNSEVLSKDKCKIIENRIKSFKFSLNNKIVVMRVE